MDQGLHEKYIGDLTISEWQKICKKFSGGCGNCPLDNFCCAIAPKNVRREISLIKLSDFGSFKL